MVRVLVSFVLLLFAATAAAQPTALKAKAFPGAQALPAIAGVQQGIFEKHGIKLELLFTQTSQEQRDGLAAGEFQVAHAAVDNAVAMVERAKHDVIIVTGGDSSMNEFFARADIRCFKNVLALRAEIEGDWGGKPPAPERYIDLSYYERARHRVGH